MFGELNWNVMYETVELIQSYVDANKHVIEYIKNDDIYAHKISCLINFWMTSLIFH